MRSMSTPRLDLVPGVPRGGIAAGVCMSAKALATGDKITVLMWPWLAQVRTVVVHSYTEFFSFMAAGGGGAYCLFDREVADEGLTWCRGWDDDEAGEALKAARLLASSNPLRLP